jgi:hypothetical protein
MSKLTQRKKTVKIICDYSLLEKINRMKIFKIAILLIFCFCSCVKTNNKETNTNITSDEGNILVIEPDFSIESFENKITGTVWFGKTMVRNNDYYSDESDEQKLKNITFTFLDDSNVQILVWEEFVLGRDGDQYDYKVVGDGIVLIINSYEPNYDNDFDDYYSMESYSIEVYKEYPAIITEDTMTFYKWINGEDLVLVRRNDLGKNENSIVIADTYYEDSKYVITIECKLLSFFNADFHFWVSFNEYEDYSVGITGKTGLVGLHRGYNRLINAFSEDEIKRFEEGRLKYLIFEYVGNGSFTEKDKENYLAKNTPPRISYIWASFGHVNDHFIAKTTRRTKFR